MDYHSKLESIHKYWFQTKENKQLWFQSNIKKRQVIDHYITIHYKEVLEIVYNIRISISLSLIEMLSMIICLDQFSRHIYRESDINIYRNKALLLTEYLCFSDRIYHLQDEELVFALMPLKHQNLEKYFNLIKIIVSNRININKVDNNNYLYKFYIDSLKKYLMLRCRVTKNVYSNLFRINELKDVCEFFPEDKPCLNNPEFITNNLVEICRKFIDSIDGKIVISLSGGPDSMVIAYIMNKLCKELDREIIAFHLNYNNRDESNIEESVISYFCDSIKLDLYIHRILHFKRKHIDRSLYEITTRNIRFKMYNLLSGNIVLGHIKEDIIENIWTNFANGRDIFKLHKMDNISKIEGVNICRPFLEVEKPDIFKFAKLFNIPYLNNTTPNNSNRGKMRTKFLPMVDAQFGENTSDRIISLARTLESYKSILDKQIFEPFYSQMYKLYCGYEINITNYFLFY